MIEFFVILAIVIVLCISSVILLRPKSKLHTTSLFEAKHSKAIIAAVMGITILCCTVPMNLSPLYNGEIPEFKDQYERITDSFLEGKLYFDYDEEDELVKLENPYDPAEREEAGVSYHWDHAYYNGKYYMYFGVVPVFLAFMPYRVITGMPLMTYHATQLFTAAFIAGLFLAFYLLAKKFFPKISFGIYLSLSVAFSAMTVWCAVAMPALYCTAITAGLATMIWGLYFWMKAVWDTDSEKKSVLFAVLGSFFGALTFGCRPTLAMGNILILGLMFYYLKERKGALSRWGKALAFVSPYIVIGILLMVYNYARFNSVFEFGQSYQLTLIDTKNFTNVISAPTIQGKAKMAVKSVIQLIQYLFNVPSVYELWTVGSFIAFPILFYIVIGLENERVRLSIKQKRIRLWIALLMLTPLVILMFDVLGSPDIVARYHMDSYWVFALSAFMVIGLYYGKKTNKRRFSFFICMLSVFTVIVCVVLFLYPSTENFTQCYYEEIKAVLGGAF